MFLSFGNVSVLKLAMTAYHTRLMISTKLNFLFGHFGAITVFVHNNLSYLTIMNNTIFNVYQNVKNQAEACVLHQLVLK